MLKIKSPGLLTTVQDLGRYGYQKFGVIASGVMDPLAHRLANLLVGNKENDPTLEITLMGPSIEIQVDTVIALCGGNLSATINGKSMGLWRPVFVKKGSLLSFGRCLSGCRTYLAVAGGYKLTKIMNSYSTYIRAEIGGFHGRPLKTNDVLEFNEPSKTSRTLHQKLESQANNRPFREADWSLSAELIPPLLDVKAIRVMEGRNTALFDEASREAFYTSTFEVSPQSDRMGYRLQGKSLHLKSTKEMISEAVSFGTIQVPSDGNPIMLLADRQTIGGYPKIGQIITVDHPKAGQLKPGDKIRFEKVSHKDAQLLFLEQEKKIQQLKQGILLKII